MMAQGRQSSEWRQTLALLVQMANLFAKNPVSVMKFLPPHLQPKPNPKREAQEAEFAWSMARAAFAPKFTRKDE